MSKQQKYIPLILISLLFLVSGCDASDSDAQKVEVKKVSTIVPPNSGEPAKPADEPKKVTKAVPQITETTSDKLAEDKAENTPKYIAGKHYVEILPHMNTDVAPDKVEVIELMWLGCPHCYDLQPLMIKYKKNHPDYVDFRQVPAMLNPTWSADAKTFYIAKILDPKGKKHLIEDIFQAIHEQKRRLHRADAAKRFIMQQGFSEQQYNNAKNSLDFQAKIKRAQEISVASHINSVPSVIVNGKYRTSAYMAGGETQLMEVIDLLTRKEKNN